MGVVYTIWVLIVFRYLSSLQFVVYLLFLDVEPIDCYGQFEMGLKFKLYRALIIMTKEIVRRSARPPNDSS